MRCEPPARLPRALRQELARTIATIHRATPALAGALPARETFSLQVDAVLHRCLTAAARIGPGERPGLRVLRDLVLPRQADILAQVARLRGLQHAVRRLDGPLVLCHTDLLGDNLLVDDQGRLSALDWDDAVVAPPEHDLQSGIGEGFADLLDAYREAGGARPLHLDHFAFYLLRRYLGDMTARLDRILEEDTTPPEDDELLHGMAAYGFARWSALDDTLAGIAAALRQRGG